MMLIMSSSGTSEPRSMNCFTFWPSGVFSRAVPRRMSPVEMWGTPRASASFLAWVPFPTAGAPTNRSLTGSSASPDHEVRPRVRVGYLRVRSLQRNCAGPALPAALDARVAAEEAAVVMHDEVGLDLVDDVEPDAHDD